MGLSCTCSGDWDDAEWVFYPPAWFSPLDAKRSRRCKSCGDLIKPGEDCLKFTRARYANCDIEERIYGDGYEIPLGPFYHCQKCGEQYLNLEALGFCVNIEENMLDLLEEYRETFTDKRVTP